ncbi:hypothetical protein IP87_17650 [beta proteobacterium AAP121]|nr:hypothetical protein IP80_01515 [beta proteobacterium AAP65]KPF95097.1 hypothetical protein IP87_17650 [beta proteobacterium AAP121]
MSIQKPPAIVTPEEWVARTSQALSSRSTALVKVDKAYAAWYARAQDRAAQTELLAALDAYLLSSGRFWHKVTRNVSSNGLMAYIHDLVREASSGKADTMQHSEIPLARYGVLYLLGNTQLENDSRKMGLEAVEQIGGLVTQGMDGPLSRALVPHTSVSAGMVLDAGLSAIGQVGGSAAARPTHQRHDGRSFIQAAQVPVAPGLYNELKTAVQNAIDAVVKKVQSALMADNLSAWRVSGTLLRQAVVHTVQFIVGHAVPFLKSGMDLGHSLAKSIELVYQNGVAARLRCKPFQMNPGHPTAIANAIQMSMLGDLGKSLLTAGLSAGKLFLEGVTAGASALASAVVSGLQWLVGWLMTQYEKSNIQDALGEASRLLQAERKLGTLDASTGRIAPNLVASRGGLIHDAKAFNAFFNRACKASVTLPMLTLNSGICGHAMTYTKMHESDASNARVIGQSNFDNSTAFFSYLKATSARYLRNKGFVYTSSKRDVAGYLMHAVRDHQQQESTAGKVLAFL